MPYHRLIDGARESLRAGGKIGTTGRGIGPCYEDKMARIGIRAGDFEDPELLGRKIVQALVEKNTLFTQLYNMNRLSKPKASANRPIQSKWEWMRWSSPQMVRRYLARRGTSMPIIFSRPSQ